MRLPMGLPPSTDLSAETHVEFKWVKEFEVREGSTANMHYRIVVLFRGKEIDVFQRPTMREARNAFEAAGYRRAYVGT